MYVERRVSRCRFLVHVNKLVYGINLLKFYVCGTITQILGNLRRMHTNYHPCNRYQALFSTQRSIGEKNGLGINEAS